jgi:hypothetical protein
MNDTPVDQLTWGKFSPLLKSRFKVHAGPSGQEELELAEANAFPSRSAPGSAAGGVRAEGFSLIFSGPRTPILPQGTYRFEHEQLGRFDLFMVPVACSADAASYEVVINRLIPGPVQAPGL